MIGGLLEVSGEDEDEEALLELMPGTTLRFDEDAYINVGYYRPGTLRAEGTAEAPIVFTSMERKQPGAWRGINLYKNATGHFCHATFEYGSRRADSGVLFANSRAALSVTDCKFLTQRRRRGAGGRRPADRGVRAQHLRRRRSRRCRPRRRRTG